MPIFDCDLFFQESQFREKVCVMEELCALREELCARPTNSVITPISPVKTEPSEVTDTC